MIRVFNRYLLGDFVKSFSVTLFVLTFVANTAAELIRQRLRKRYSSL